MKLFIAALSCMLCSVLSENLVTVENSCPRKAVEKVGDERYFSVVNDTCFLFMTYDKVEYETAKAKCQANEGNLAMPKTKELNDFLLQEMLKVDAPGAMWIGMHDKEVDGKYVWEDGTEVVPWGNMDYWTGGVFFGDGEDCIALEPTDGEWHDYRCANEKNSGILSGISWLYAKLPFICQYPIETAEDDKLDQITPSVEQGPSVEVKDGSGSSGDAKGEPGSPGVVKGESGSSGDVKDEPGSPGVVKGEPGSPGVVKDESGSSGDVKGKSGSPGDLKGESGSPGDVKGESGSSGDAKDEPGSSEPVKDSSVVKQDTCPPFDCPKLDCRMNGFKIKDGCQICECDV